MNAGRIVLSALVLLGGCRDSSTPQVQDPGILLTITSQVPVEGLELRARNSQLDSSEAAPVLGNRDLERQPYTVFLRQGDYERFTGDVGAHDAEWLLPFGDEILVHARGLLGGDVVAGAARILRFGGRQNETLVLRGDFADADGDGFESCAGRAEGCDCNDQNPAVNPYVPEDCSDFIDNNCSGPPINEGCPCNRDQACTEVPGELQELAGIGMCYFGTVACVDGELSSTCTGGTFNPVGEVPDNLLDDDCDGVVDEGSDCTPGQRRRCFLGWVEPFPGEAGADYPPEIQFAFVYDAPGVTCITGEQVCGATGRWENTCVGEVRPQRALDPDIGWLELPTMPSEGVCGQCDGLDNDCNGQFDEEPWFDADQDGYTVCGTRIRTGGDPTVPDHKVTGMHADYVDCDDSRSDVNPGMVEICGNTVDEDCRCDHGDPITEIGQPYLQPPNPADCSRPPPTCPSTSAALDCARLPRSDANPTGVCHFGPSDCAGCEPHYHGYFGANDDCYLCTGEQFGFRCSHDGGCSTQADDCVVCDAATPSGPTDPSLVRPFCTERGTGCSGAVGPQWVPLFGTDPDDECDGLSCQSYYWSGGVGGSGILDGQCFEMADQTAAEVDCNGREQCETAAVLCPQETERKLAPELPPTICQEVVSGCIGTVPPVYDDQPNNTDLLNECNDAYTCHDAGAGGGPFYFGIEADGNGDDQCFFRADVASSFCNGAGACQTRLEACTTSARGQVVPGRPICEAPTGGCTGEAGPSYSPITDGTDPYDDCPLSDDGSTDRTCKPTGGCYADLGDTCASNADCQPPWTCASMTCVE